MVMRSCTALRGSSAIFRRHYNHLSAQCPSRSSSTTRPVSGDRDATTSTELPPQPESFCVDSNGKTVQTAAGDLPLSPVMDPTFWEAQDRFKQKKPKSSKPLNMFERQFRKSPFAHALATPVRFDSVTRLRMPAFFFQDFNIISHPETGDPWWVPRSLALRHPSTSDAAGAPLQPALDVPEGAVDIPEETEPGTGMGDELGMSAAKRAKAEDASPSSTEMLAATAPESAAKSASSKVLGPTAYILARQNVLKSFQDPGTPKKGSRTTLKDIGNSEFHRRIIGPSSSKFRAVGGRAVWREDMDVFVLNQMREQIVEDLVYLSTLCETDSRYYIVKCYGWDDIQFKQKGAVLWFGEDGKEAVTPGPFATFDIDSKSAGQTSVVVHNLPMLLGAELAAKLRTKTKSFADGFIFMLAGRRTTDLQLKLWKLQGYIYSFKEPR